jgi:hypothetical protein
MMVVIPREFAKQPLFYKDYQWGKGSIFVSRVFEYDPKATQILQKMVTNRPANGQPGMQGLGRAHKGVAW